MSLCITDLANFLQGSNGAVVITASLTLAALGFSIFGTIYSNLVHNAEMAEGNLKTDTEKTKKTKAYSYWSVALSNFRELAKRRAYTANLFCWSLLFILVTLIARSVHWPEWVCSIAFIIAIALFFIAIAIVIVKRKWLLKLISIFSWPAKWPVHTNVKGLTEDPPEE